MDLLQRILALGGNIGGNIFGGPSNPALSPEQNRAALGQGLMRGGLQTILASQPGAGPGGGSPTALGAIAQGALAGQQAGTAARQEAARAQLGGGGLTVEGLREVAQQALALGDMDTFRAVSDMLSQTASAGSDLINPATGDLLRSATSLDSMDLGDRVVFFPEGNPSDVQHVMMKSGDEGTSRQMNQLATEYARRISDDITRARAISNINQLMRLPQTPANDMSLVFAYMKMLDPASTVREGEYTNAQNTTGIADRAYNLYDAVLKGYILTPAQRREFAAVANQMVASQKGLLDQTMSLFRRRARASGVPLEQTDLIVFDPYDAAVEYAPYAFPGAGDAPPVAPGTNPIDRIVGPPGSGG